MSKRERGGCQAPETGQIRAVPQQSPDQTAQHLCSCLCNRRRRKSLDNERRQSDSGRRERDTSRKRRQSAWRGKRCDTGEQGDVTARKRFHVKAFPLFSAPGGDHEENQALRASREGTSWINAAPDRSRNMFVALFSFSFFTLSFLESCS